MVNDAIGCGSKRERVCRCGKMVIWWKNKIKDLDGLGWSRYLDTAYKEKEERVIEYAPLLVGSGALELSGRKAKRQRS